MTPEMLKRYRFHAEWSGSWVGHNAESAIKLARAESAIEDMIGEGLARYCVEDEDMDPADCFENEKDIEAIRSGANLWIQIALETRPEPCDCERDPEDCRCGGWEMRANLGGIAVLGWRDPYIRTVKAELASEVLASLEAPRVARVGGDNA